MPAYKNLPAVISAVCRILVTGEQANLFAIKAYIKADIKRKLLSKKLTPDEFEAELAVLVADRLYTYARMQLIGAPFSHALDYGLLADLDLSTSTDAYVEANAALKLTPRLAEQIGKKILNAKIPIQDYKVSKLHDLSEKKLLGILLKKICDKQMSLDLAIKTFYIIEHKAALTQEYYQERMLALPQNERIALSNKVEDFFINKITRHYADKFKEEIRQELKTETEAYLPEIVEHNRYFYFKDDCFPLYCANWIKGQNYIAMSGAQNSDSVAALMYSLTISETMKDKPQVTTIIALGDCVKRTTHRRQDFFNYCYDDRDQETKDREQTKGKTFPVSLETGEEKPSVNYQYEITVTNRSDSSCYTSSSGFVLSDLEGAGHKMEVLLIGLTDGCSLDLGIDSPETEQLKELLWRVTQKPSSEATAVHCAAGVGRTGHIILMLEIIKNYQHIFASDKPDVIASEIQAIVINMRETRPALVSSLEQYLTAIKNADIVYQYALKKKYIAEPVSLGAMSLLAPAPGPQAEQIEQVEEQKSWCRVC